MILTCPACGTQYVVKDGAIPPQGRQVRCASCKHSWHQDPEQRDFDDDGETLAEAAVIEPRSGPAAEERAFQAAALADQPIPDGAEAAAGRDEADVEPIESVAPSESVEPVEPIEPEQAPAAEADAHDGAIADEQAVNQDWTGTPAEPTYDDEFSPFAAREPEPRRRSPLLTILIIAVLTAAAA